MPSANNQELRRLAPKLAHNIRDELSLVQNAIDDLLSGRTSLSPDVRNNIGIIQHCLSQVDQKAKVLLVASNALTKPMQVLDVREVLSDVAPLLWRMLGKDVQLQLTFAPNLWPIKADMEYLEEVLLILAANARDAMPRGGKFSVNAANFTKEKHRRNGRQRADATDYLLIEVADTGTGIAKHVLDRMFQPFVTTKGPGCGLGLTIAHNKIKEISGHVEVESAPRKGTTFRILLPRHMPVETAI